ncbi:hypothetical protein NKI38_27275 [Mesorhizobium sp. M0621]|uniref:hypothetical protein n=1 Tax=Mesorhizobium sp. M0621 TaxID=2956974 RepID=UPI0033370F6E
MITNPTHVAVVLLRPAARALASDRCNVPISRRGISLRGGYLYAGRAKHSDGAPAAEGRTTTRRVYSISFTQNSRVFSERLVSATKAGHRSRKSLFKVCRKQSFRLLLVAPSGGSYLFNMQT